MSEVLGVDFGTSNTVGVLVASGRPPRALAIDGAAWIPSAIYVEDNGSLAVGRDAERMSRQFPERFEANPKRRIDDGDILLGVRVVSVVDAISAVLHRVVDEARRQLNGKTPDEVHLTHPAKWGAARQNVLLAAAREAGLGPNITLVAEPVAAAAHFASLPGKSLPAGASLAVYDLGGGTFDCAIVTATGNGFSVLAEAGLPDIGGVDLDQALFDHLGRTASSEDPARWQGIAGPRNAADRRAARVLREDVRAAKETLSRHAQTEVPMPDPFDDTLVTRAEFEGLIRPSLTRTVELLIETVQRAGLQPDQLAGIYLVGGSSRIPLVAKLIGEMTGIVATTLDQPETSVATGAALAPGTPSEPGRTGQLPPQGQPGPGAQSSGVQGPGTHGQRPQGPPPAGHGPGPQGQPGQPGQGPQGLFAQPQPQQPHPGTGGLPLTGNNPGNGNWGQSTWSGPSQPNQSGPPGSQGQPGLQGQPGMQGQAGTGQYGPGNFNAPPGGQTEQKNWHQPGVYVPPPNPNRKRLITMAGIAAVVVIAVVVTLVIVLSGGSKAPETGSTACASTADSSGITGCMRNSSGSLITNFCTTDLSGLGLEAADATALKNAANGLVVCTNAAQASATSGALIGDVKTQSDFTTELANLKGKLTIAVSGNWAAAKANGAYSAGVETDSSGTKLSYVVWQSSTSYVFGLYFTADASSVTAAVSEWKGKLGATVTG